MLVVVVLEFRDRFPHCEAASFFEALLNSPGTHGLVHPGPTAPSRKFNSLEPHYATADTSHPRDLPLAVEN